MESEDEEQAYLAVRFWRNATVEPDVCTFLQSRDFMSLLEPLSRLNFQQWPSMQSDVTCLISNICTALPDSSVAMVSHLSGTLDQPAMLRALFLARDDYCYLTVSQGEGVTSHDIIDKFPEEWIDFDLDSLCEHALLLKVPSHHTLSDLVGILFEGHEFSNTQEVQVGFHCIQVDNRRCSIGEQLNFLNTETKDYTSGLLWEVTSSEVWIRLSNGTVNIVPISQLENGVFILVDEDGGSQLWEQTRSLSLKQLCQMQSILSPSRQKISVVCRAKLALGLFCVLFLRRFISIFSFQLLQMILRAVIRAFRCCSLQFHLMSYWLQPHLLTESPHSPCKCHA